MNEAEINNKVFSNSHEYIPNISNQSNQTKKSKPREMMWFVLAFSLQVESLPKLFFKISKEYFHILINILFFLKKSSVKLSFSTIPNLRWVKASINKSKLRFKKSTHTNLYNELHNPQTDTSSNENITPCQIPHCRE